MVARYDPTRKCQQNLLEDYYSIPLIDLQLFFALNESVSYGWTGTLKSSE